MNDASDSSNLSTITEFNSAELAENVRNLESPVKRSAEELRRIKKQSLLKKLALSDLSAPRLANESDYVDVYSKEDEQRNMEWIKNKFAGASTSNSAKMKPAVGVAKLKEEKVQLMRNLASKRRKDQDKRKQLYAMDNEELFDNEEVEDDFYAEDGIDMEDEEHSEDEKKEEEEEGADEMPHEAPTQVLVKEDHEGEESEAHKMDDTMHKEEENCLDVIAPFPESLSQWFDRSDDNLIESPKLKRALYKDMMDEIGGEEDESQTDLLNLCSGAFVSQEAEESEIKPPVLENEEDEDDFVHKSSKKKVESDDEDEEDGTKMEKEDGEMVVGKKEDAAHNEDESTTNEEEELANKVFNRVVIVSDEDSEGEEEENTVGEEEEEEEDDDDEEAATGKENEEIDSDDELAVFKKQERERREFFEDEAELSGDDVGSDGEDENDISDHYEVEEGDADEVPDDEELRVDLHKQLMKQQESTDHRELIQLRQRLLGDDLDVVETNRTFRLKLREDDEGDVRGEESISNEEEEEIEEAVNIEAIRRRIEMEREMEERAEGGEDEDEEEDKTDAFSSLAVTVSSTNNAKATTGIGRVRASLLHMDSSRILGKENVVGKEKKSVYFVASKDGQKEEDVEGQPLKRKNTVACADVSTTKRAKQVAPLTTTSLFKSFQ